MTTKKKDTEPMTSAPDDEPQPIMPKRGADDPRAEIALRTGDTDEKQASRFTRVFAIPAYAHGTLDDDALHRRNSLVVLEQAIQQGLHPTDDVSFDGAQEQPTDEVGYDHRYPLVRLTYSVDVTPAALHEDASETRTPGRVLREELDGSTESDKR